MLHTSTSLGSCLNPPNYGIQKQASRMSLAKQQDELSSVIIFGHKLRWSSKDNDMNKGIITHWSQYCISVAVASAPTAATLLSSHDIILAANCQRGSKATSILNDSFNKEGKTRMRISCRLPASLDPSGYAAPAGRPPDDHEIVNVGKDDDNDYNNNNNTTEFLGTVSKRLNTLYQFSRPHTIIGTIIGISSVSLLPIQSFADISPAFFAGLLKAMVPSILMNVYVVGLNQLFDVDIDKVNKPKLPLASGEFSMETGSIIVTVCSLLSFATGFMSQSPPLLVALVVSFLLGSAYSVDLPLLRWKKQAVLAAFCIVMVRAMLVQLAFFIHFQKYVLGRPVMLTRSVIFATAFMCFFVTVIALFKDIPDADGDRDFGIQSFTVRLGKHKVFWLCINLLSLAYGAASVLGFFSPLLILPTKFVVIIGHSALACILWLRAQSVDLTNNVSVASFYMFIWKLFYAEYFLIPFVR